ncbi:hypothetical protein [Clostridium algidicarnis]|uniref:hypothetical protein n=1 Tax=Clostridium algidicarnis TaxID=37659 RepID=UPI001C0CD401|nr:hypothetical protein [Clostridium algidicarnis]MBU3205173.1 hypothetical protein [Clostridium algidicarnis]MBU3213326.1 hypothetical protein [Clostridium algidicarnis]MBU3223779.1 hypothetical protein [Clostridium algidicarnis]
MNTLLITLAICNLVVTASLSMAVINELTKINRNIEILEKNISEGISTNTCNLAWELSSQKKLLKENKITKEDIRAAVKGEIADEIKKLAFTPIKMDFRR